VLLARNVAAVLSVELMDENNKHMPVFLHHAIYEGRARGQRSVSPETETVLHEACGLDGAELEFPLELGVSCAARMPGIIKSTNAAPGNIKRNAAGNADAATRRSEPTTTRICELADHNQRRLWPPVGREALSGAAVWTIRLVGSRRGSGGGTAPQQRPHRPLRSVPWNLGADPGRAHGHDQHTGRERGRIGIGLSQAAENVK
jgi:hypothetical protein